MAKKTKLTYDWSFRHFADGKCPEAVLQPSFDDSDWERVRVPHDFAISGEFREDNDCSYSTITADGVTRPLRHSGRTGALPILGCGVYRRWIEIPEGAKGKCITLEFDGVMWEANVYVNGQKVYFNHFGYKSFEVDITHHIACGKPALIAVTAEVFSDCSRWYPGGGIYRNAYLVEKESTHIRYDGVFVKQLEIADDHALFELAVEQNGDDSVKLEAEILAPDGKTVAKVSQAVSGFGELSAVFSIPTPLLWDVEHPHLYRAEVALCDRNGAVLDRETVKFGVRTVAFDADRGFFLNGRSLKLQGVCLHHDLGSLGAAFHVAAARRQLNMMAQMGANAIRTTHNPPARELLDLCDEMGFLVIDEFFDEWYTPKIANGYSKYFFDHAEADAESIIKRDRNHPSVILWSIGNEVEEQLSADGWKAPKMLAAACHRTDPTRLVTAGFNMLPDAIENHLTAYVDVVGFNYQPRNYERWHIEHPEMKLYGSETESCVSTRGVYDLPAEIDIPCKKREDLSISAYEMSAPAWAYYPEREFAAQDDGAFIGGEFVWTGFDYLGEPTPYYAEWPSRSSYFGIVDLAGLPKNRYSAYMAKWTKKKVLHVFPHWNWEGNEGEVVPVHAYASEREAELFINGKSFGRRSLGDRSGGALGEIERYRFMWDNAVYEPGEVRVVAYDETGAIAAEATVKTAGEPYAILLTADRGSLASDGDDLVYVTAKVVDKDGTVCPHFTGRLFFSAENAELLTTDNGDQRETESFVRPDKKCLAGCCVACVRSVLGNSGKVTVTVQSAFLPTAAIEIAYT